MKITHPLLPAFKALATAALTAFLCVNASAQSDWPKAKPVTLLVAFSWGGGM